MTLKNLRYFEYENDPRYWELTHCDFAPINLVVGKNATGKSRLISVTGTLCNLLAGKRTAGFESGSYDAEFSLSNRKFSLHLSFDKNKVIKETLLIDNEVRLTRDSDGKGKIYYEQTKDFLDFQIPQESLAIQQRRDELQHPFIMELSNWAQGCQVYLFGSSEGRTTIVPLSMLPSFTTDTSLLVSAYGNAFVEYGDSFDLAIIRDMQSLGFDISEVGTDDMRPIPNVNITEPVVGMFVVEKGRPAKLFQMYMSEGMYRALNLVIRINIAAFSNKHTLVLVDDIGEGLDYERSSGLIDVLIKHAKNKDLQLIMTSNDRFVMNRVPLEHWSILRREGANVSAHTQRSNPKEFDDFQFLGLSNFDFFTSATFQ